MTCQDTESRLAEFLAGELVERSEVEEHLLACAECRAKFSVAKSGWEAAKEWKVAGPSGDAIAATLAALEPAAPSRGLVRFLQVGTLAASLVVAFVIGTSGRGEVAETPPTLAAQSPSEPASTGLASLRPSVGLLFVQDENGRPAGELAIRRLSVHVDIRDGIARTEIEEIFENRTDRRLEGTFQFPLPPDASISRLAMEIEGKLMEGEVVEREKARRTYEGIVRSMKDPALLEWMPGGLFQCRIFPIEPRSDKRIVIAYTQALSVFDGRGRYVYPLSGESTRELGIGRFEFSATVRAGSKIVSSGSTSHKASTVRIDDRTMRTTFEFSNFRPRADFVLAFEMEAREEIQVAAHRPEGPGPGYFTAFLTPRADPEEDLRQDRKLYFLLDASGSVARAELEAARTVVRRMVEALRPADRFRIGCHNLFVGSMAESVAPDEAGKRAADRYLADIATAGACDFSTAIETVLADVSDHGELVYVGEGTPTWGEKDPAKIVARIRQAIGTRRISIRTVAVGSDAERGLLETVSREFNGGAHSISPSDDVHARAGEIARTLGRSALSEVKVAFKGAVTDAAPAILGSLHFGERLLVTGRYDAGPVTLVLTGRVHDRTIQREFALALPEREAGNLHVKRLWAQRRLADLVALGEEKKADAVKLSVEHQVMTPYTSFLVLENEKAYEEHQIERSKKDNDSQAKQKRTPAIKPVPLLDGEVLANQIKAAIDADSWNESQGRSVVFQNGLMVVRNTPEVHKKVRKYLNDLRRARAGEAGDWPKESTAETGPAAAGVQLDLYNVQDLTYGLQDFPGVNIQLSEDALAASSQRNQTVREGTMGKLINDPTPAQQVASFLDPDGGDSELALKAYDEQEGSRLRFARSYRLPLSTDGTPRIQDYDIQVARASAAPDPIPPQLFGINQSVTIPGNSITPALSLLVDTPPARDNYHRGWIQPSDMRVDGFYTESHSGPDHGFDDMSVDYINRPPVGGYDIGGVGFTEIDKLQAGLNTFGRQLEVQLLQISDAMANVDEKTKQLNAANNQRLAATQDLQYSRQEAERLSKDLGALEDNFRELARERQRLQETIANLNARPVGTDFIAPMRALAGKVTAAASELDLVVISIGRDAGVIEGDEFTISRGKEFAGKIVVDHVDRQWSSGKLILKGKLEPQLGDDASNNVPVAPRKMPPVMKVAAIAGDAIDISGIDPAQVKKGDILVLARDWKYVAAIEVIDVLETTAKTRVVRRLRAQPIEAGDLAVSVKNLRELWSVLPESMRLTFTSERALAAARYKLNVLRSKARGTR